MIAEETRLLTACSDQELLMYQLSQQRAEGGEGEGGEGEERGRGKRKAEVGEEDTGTGKVSQTFTVSEWSEDEVVVARRPLCAAS